MFKTKKIISIGTIIIFFSILNCAILEADEPIEEWYKNHKFASLTIYVKSNQENMRVGGAKVRIRRQARKKCNLKEDPALMPISPWYEVKRRSSGDGKIVITDWEALTGSGRGGRAFVKRTSPRPWIYLEIEVSATDFKTATDSTWLSFWEPEKTLYFYLSPK